jgi:hypothetical protein
MILYEKDMEGDSEWKLFILSATIAGKIRKGTIPDARNAQALTWSASMKRTLECSSAGDVRFSAFGAYVTIFGIRDSIEFHYQLSKGFSSMKAPGFDSSREKKMHHIRRVKGRSPDYLMIGPYRMGKEHLSSYYKYLWIVYLDSNPGLVEYASGFDSFTDRFRGKSVNCQADVIARYVKGERDEMIRECSEFAGALEKMKRGRMRDE